MTPTLLSLLSILFGIIGSNSIRLYKKKYSFNIAGNTIAGVFGSVLCIKTIGRLGIDPLSIVDSGVIDNGLLLLNLVVSFIGGTIFVVVLSTFKSKI